MADFEEAYKVVKANEGGYVNDPTDRGGETAFGIARKKWPNWQGWFIVDVYKNNYGTDPKTITKLLKDHPVFQRMVSLFYRENFWDANKLSGFDQRTATELFDTGVNQGAKAAARYLQEALNLCNNNGKIYPNIKIDGHIGPATTKAYKAADPERVFWTLNLLQGERYLNIVRKDETQEKYWGGWLKRVFK